MGVDRERERERGNTTDRNRTEQGDEEDECSSGIQESERGKAGGYLTVKKGQRGRGGKGQGDSMRKCLPEITHRHWRRC